MKIEIDIEKAKKILFAASDLEALVYEHFLNMPFNAEVYDSRVSMNEALSALHKAVISAEQDNSTRIRHAKRCAA